MKIFLSADSIVASVRHTSPILNPIKIATWLIRGGRDSIDHEDGHMTDPTVKGVSVHQIEHPSGVPVPLENVF